MILISCSERKEVTEPAIDTNEITVVNIFYIIPGFSEWFGSSGDDDPIWQYNEGNIPEGCIKRIEDSQLKINGISILSSESLVKELHLDKNKGIPPTRYYKLRSCDEKISSYIQDKELISISLRRGVS